MTVNRQSSKKNNPAMALVRLLLINSDDRQNANERTNTASASFRPEHTQFGSHQGLRSIAVRNAILPHAIYNVRNYVHPEYGPMNTFTYVDQTTTRVITLAEGFYSHAALVAALMATAAVPAGGAVTVAAASLPTYRATFADAAATSLRLPLISNGAGEQCVQWIARMLGFSVNAATAATGAAGFTIAAAQAPDARPTTNIHVAFRKASTPTSLTAMEYHPQMNLNSAATQDQTGSITRVLASVPLMATYGEVILHEDHSPVRFQFTGSEFEASEFRVELVDDAGVILDLRARWSLVCEVSLTRL